MASTTLDASQNANSLVFANFNFSIPADALAIVGIVVELYHYGAGVSTMSMVLMNDTNAITGTDICAGTPQPICPAAWPNGNNLQLSSYGSPTSLWGST
jgi:hypothetical protein